MKPLSIKTEFSFSISRDFVNVITDSFEGGMFEKLDVAYGKKTGHYALKNTHIVYSLSTTIQQVKLDKINVDYISRVEKRFKNTFFKRISTVKREVKELKIKTSVIFIDNISIAL